MASKRTHCETDSAESDTEDLIEKKLCTKREVMKPKTALLELLPILPDNSVGIEPSASSRQSFDDPCSSVATVPSDSRLAASLTSELDIKEEATDDEQDIYDDEDSKSKINEQIDEEQEFGLEEYCEVKEEEENAEKNTSWTKNSSSMKSFLFTMQDKFLTTMPREPFDLFRLFLDDELLDLIVKETNKNALKSEKTWIRITRDEVIVFIGLIIHTGTISMHRLSDYWNIHYLFSIKSFARFMKRQRFLQIFDYLSFSSATHKDDVNKIQPVINHFNKKMLSIYYPGANLIVTKSITIHGGNIVLSEENRRKRMVQSRVTRVHILTETKGIVLKLNVTQGNVKYDSVVLDLLFEKLDRGHSVYLTEEYNSLQTTLLLLNRNTYCTGPLHDHFVQPMQTSLSMIVTQEDLYNKNGSYYCDGVHLFRRDKHFYVSSQYDQELLHLPTPTGRVTVKSKLVAMYDSVMDVDIEENLMTYYPCRENSQSWHKKVFIHVLQLAIANAFKFHGSKNRFYNFRLDILEKMLPATPPQCGRTTNVHRPHVLTTIEMVKMRERRVHHGQVYVTKEVVRKTCRGCRIQERNKRKTTIYECRQCEGSPGYCEECFERVHSADDVIP